MNAKSFFEKATSLFGVKIYFFQEKINKKIQRSFSLYVVFNNNKIFRISTKPNLLICSSWKIKIGPILIQKFADQNELIVKFIKRFVINSKPSLQIKHADYTKAHDHIDMVMQTKNGGLIETLVRHRYAGSSPNSPLLVAISVQEGCPVNCKFCSVPLESKARNLNSKEILEQIALALKVSAEHGINLEQGKIKLSITKGGDSLYNPHVVSAVEELMYFLPLDIKLSTVFPDTNLAKKIAENVLLFARNYFGGTFVFQISLNSTDQHYRETEMVRHGKIKLLSLEQIAIFAEDWLSRVRYPRQISLTFTLMKDAPADPKVLSRSIPPTLTRVRLKTAKSEPTVKINPLSLEEHAILKKQFIEVGFTEIPWEKTYSYINKGGTVPYRSAGVTKLLFKRNHQ